jgi:hypothetical protein
MLTARAARVRAEMLDGEDPDDHGFEVTTDELVEYEK